MSVLADRVADFERRASEALAEAERFCRILRAAKAGAYSTAGMVALRRQAESLCGDPDCHLSGGESHAGNPDIDNF